MTMLGKQLIALFSFISLLGRVFAVILYFSPSFGLMNLLMHWKMGQLPAPSKEQFSKYDVTENGTIIYFEDVWLKVQSYTALTMFDLETYFVVFLCLIPVHYLMVFACKFCFAIDFKKKGNVTQKLFHILTHLVCPITFKDWDEIAGFGDVVENKKNLAKVLKEMKYLQTLFAVEHIALCTPVFILASSIYNRNQYLNEYFPPGVYVKNHFKCQQKSKSLEFFLL